MTFWRRIWVSTPFSANPAGCAITDFYIIRSPQKLHVIPGIVTGIYRSVQYAPIHGGIWFGFSNVIGEWHIYDHFCPAAAVFHFRCYRDVNKIFQYAGYQVTSGAFQFFLYHVRFIILACIVTWVHSMLILWYIYDRMRGAKAIVHISIHYGILARFRVRIIMPFPVNTLQAGICPISIIRDKEIDRFSITTMFPKKLVKWIHDQTGCRIDRAGKPIGPTPVEISTVVHVI